MDQEKTKKVTCGRHEVSRKSIGDMVTVTSYKTAKIGSGMDRSGSVTGKLLSVDMPVIKCYGCSFTWSQVTLQIQ